MRRGTYSSPATDYVAPPVIKGNPAIAIFLGLLLSYLGAFISGIVVGAVGSYNLSMAGYGPSQIDYMMQTDSSILLWYLFLSSGFSMWSGYYVANKTNHREYEYGAILGLVGTLAGLALFFFIPEVYELQPTWYNAAGFISYPIAVLLGCWLRECFKPATPTP